MAAALAGREVAAGTTTPRGVDPSAELNVHTIDFTSVTRRGTGYVLVVDGETSHPFDVDEAAYEQLRRDTKIYFYTQRSGIAIDDALVPGYGRAAGHLGVAPNQGDFKDGCAAQFCYVDDIGSWATNEMTINWNAPMSWASSFVADLDRGDEGARR